MGFRTIATLAALAATAPALAIPTNLVTNGSFETGDFSGWTRTGAGSDYVGVTEGALLPGDGGFFAYFGTQEDISGIEQTIATRSGAAYQLSFDLENQGGIPSSKLVTFGGATITAAADESAYGPTHYSYVVHATGPSTVLDFAFRQDPNYYLLDNVSLTATAPEPATWALMIGGFGLVGAAQRRRAVVAA